MSRSWSPSASSSTLPTRTVATAVGDPRIVARFWTKVDKAGPPSEHRPDLGPCWLWTDKPHTHGYGRFHLYRQNGRNIREMAHRFAYRLLVGPIPEGRRIDHLCRVRLCVNPTHLEPVTEEENRRRGLAHELNKANHQTAKTRCPKGHLYDDANTYVDKTGGRRCRRCNRERMRAVNRA